MDIKKAQAENLEDIRQLLADCHLPEADLGLDALDHYYIAYSKNSELVGVVGIEPHGNAGVLRSLAVKPDFRNQGFGYLLVKTAEHAARAANLDVIYLLTENAKQYLQRFGYESVDKTSVPVEVATSALFSGLCPESADCLCLRVPAEQLVDA